MRGIDAELGDDQDCGDKLVLEKCSSRALIALARRRLTVPFAMIRGVSFHDVPEQEIAPRAPDTSRRPSGKQWQASSRRRVQALATMGNEVQDRFHGSTRCIDSS